VVGQQNADIADTLRLRDVTMTAIFVFLYVGVHWRHLANRTESSVCGGDATLCQITFVITRNRKQRRVIRNDQVFLARFHIDRCITWIIRPYEASVFPTFVEFSFWDAARRQSNAV